MDRHNGKSPDGRAAGSATGESCEFSYYAHPLTGHPLSVSSAVEKMFGFTPEEWREEEKLWERIVHPDDRIRVLKEFEEARTRIKDTCFIYRILTRDRAVRWVEDHITWEKDQDGNPVQIRGRMYDIIHRRGEDVKKEREHALLRAVNRLFIETFTSKTDEDVAQSALAAAKELTGSRSGFVAKLDDGRFFVVATSGEEWKVAETPHPLRDVMEERLKSLGIWERILTEKTPLIINQFVLHFHLEMPQGHPPVTSLLAVPLTGEEEVYGMIVLADKEDGYDLWDQEAVESFAAILTETLMRKEIERELTIKEKTIESSMNGIVLADAKGVITYANPSFITMWGFEKTEGVIGKAVLDFWKNKRQAQKAMEETINKGMYVGELKGKRKDGSEFEAQFSTRVIEDENDNILCIMGVFEDITHRKQTELTRRKLLHGLRERIKELRCLYTIGEMTREKDTSIEELLERVVRIMPKAFRYPSAAVVRIVLEDLTYETPGFREAKWVLKKPMVINGKQEGWVEVRYVKEEPLCNGTPFLEEEDLVVRSVANRVASFLERKRSEERVKTYYTQLEKEVEERTRELREAQEELVRKEKLAVMGQLAGSVGHELRNP
ncbi:MAG: PAS domain S-box protein, partial [Theionarchaea archaeon]|nr:PAS domain S-box protein [Theionarchaea archaeon]